MNINYQYFFGVSKGRSEPAETQKKKKKPLLLDDPPGTPPGGKMAAFFFTCARFVKEVAMIFGPVIPYYEQFQYIRKTKTLVGFNPVVCLILLVCNILRVEYW